MLTREKRIGCARLFLPCAALYAHTTAKTAINEAQMLKKYVLPVGIIVFMILSLGMGLGVMVFRLGDAQERSVNDQQQVLITNLSTPILSSLQSIRLAAEFVAVSGVTRGALMADFAYDRSATSYDLQRILGLFPLLEGAFVLDVNLRQVLASSPLEVPPDYTAVPFVRAALKGRRTLSPPMASPFTGNMVMAAASPIASEDRIIGVAVVLINLRKMADTTTNRMSVGSAGYAMLLDATGRFLLHPDPSQIGRYVGDSELGQQVMDAKMGFASGLWNGNKRWVAFSQLEEMGWKVLVSMDYTDYVFQVTYLRDGALLVGAVLVLFVVLGVGWLTVRLMAGLDGARLSAERTVQAKSDFLANMSHEIRTPLNGIIGLTHLLRGTPLNAQQTDYLAKIHYSGKNLLCLLNDMLDMSKLDANKLTIEPTDCALHDVLDFVVSSLGGVAADKGLALVVQVDDHVPALLHTDPYRLGQVLLNLTGNAIKFTAAGEVRLALAAEGLTPERPWEPFNLRVAVSDTGIGMDAETMARLFTPFSQADSSSTRRFGGTGLGLVISNQLVQLLGGEMSVSSEPGRGSTFCFFIRCQQGLETTCALTLPAPPAAPDVPVMPEAAPDAAADFDGAEPPGALVTCADGSPPRVLLVEDNEINQLVASEVLRGMGAEVRIACNGKEAVEAVLAESFVCIFMDIQMPVMDGLTATRCIREHDPQVPIVAMTAHALPEDREKSFAAGMNAHLTKPIDVEALRQILRCFALHERQGGMA